MIRLATVIGHGIELLPHFIKHYQPYVDEINIVVYETEQFPLLGNQVREIVDNYDKVKIVKVHQDRIFDWERVTMLYNYVTNKQPNDWWVIADIDEFHLYTHDHLPTIIKSCNEYGYVLVRGGFIDRIGPNGEFEDIKPDISIWEQFPNAGFFRYPLSGANPNKVCIKKGHVELTSGQHYAKLDGHTTWRWQGWNHPLINKHDSVQVHHFKWDRTAIERIKDVASIKKPYAYSDEYQLMYDKLRKCRFKIDLTNPEFMFSLDLTEPKFRHYRRWNKLYNKIISI
jgi:hypothetical protein